MSKRRARRFVHAGPARVEVSSGIDWFELRAEVDYGDTTVSLPQLLEAVRRGDTMVALGDGSFGLLPEEWLEKFAPLAGLGTKEDGHLRFRKNQAGLLDALLAAQPEVRVDEMFERVRQGLRDFHGVRAAAAAARVRRPVAGLSARGRRLDGISARVRLRRLPGGRHGSRENGAGAGRAGIAKSRGKRAVAGCGSEISDVQLAGGGGTIHAAFARAGTYRIDKGRRFDRELRFSVDHVRDAAA